MTLPSEATRIKREVFCQAFLKLGGVDRLVKWAEGLEGTCTTPTNGDNLKDFYKLFAKTLPKEIRRETEDLNKTQENFVKWIQAEEEKLRLEEGRPNRLIDAPAKVAEKG
jgi:hypothetical protein